MNSILKIASRNLAANKRRTLITVVIITIGLCSVNTGKGIMSGMQKESELGVTEGRTGEIQIHKRGYFYASELTLLDYAIDDYRDLREEIMSIEGVRYVAGRIHFGGLVATEEQTTPVFCRGVEAANELKVCPRVTENIIEGRFLTANAADEAVMAGGLSKGIRVGLGDPVIIVANTEDGFQNAIEVEIVGIIEEKIAQANARLVYLPVGTAQRLLYMEDKVNEVVIKTDGRNEIEAVNRTINGRLRGRLLRSSTWKEVATFFVDVMRKQNVIILAVCFIFYFIVMSSITNTMTLAVFERKREIGTMMAVGIKPGYITRLIVVEGMMIGLLGSLVGIMASSAVIVILGAVGLTRTPPGSLVPVTINPFISWPFMMVSFGLGILSAVVASIYPARRTLEVDPADALRGV